MTQALPLFPLGTALLPGQVLPLHVFEPRYRDLVHDLVSGPRSLPGRRGPCFGVVAIRSGHEVGSGRVPALYAVGCVAELLEVQRHEDGTSDLVAVGRERFRLMRLDDDAGTAYFTGQVEWLEEPLTPSPAGLVGQVRALFVRYAQALSGYVEPGAAHQVPATTADPTLLSWIVSGAMVLHPHERQDLLAAPDAAHRLQALRTLLRRELGLLAVAPSVPANDLVRQFPDPR